MAGWLGKLLVHLQTGEKETDEKKKGLTWKHRKHTEVADPAVTPTCTEPGVTAGSHCSVCGTVLQKQDIVPPLGHKAVKIEAIAPTCMELGLTEGKYCERCGSILKPPKKVPALGHVPQIIEGFAATCTQSGMTNGIVCQRCGMMLEKSIEIPASGHNTFSRRAVPSSCTECGWTSGKYCRTCGEVLKAPQKIQPRGHEAVIDLFLEPTCIETGFTEGNHCKICGQVLKEQQVIPALGHEIEIDASKASTCTETGLTEGKHCQRCEAVLEEQKIIPALGHDVVIDEAKAPTCTETGLTEGKHCQRCGVVLEKQKVLPALGHDVVIDEAKTPICTETGLTEGKHCQRCGTILEEQKIIPALGHDIVIDEAKTPTCTETGLTEGKHCQRCGAVLKEQKIIPALGHDVVIDEVKAPTCTETGFTEGKHCQRCGTVLEEQQIMPALGHDAVIDEAKAPTCTETGFTEGKHCQRCGAVLEEQRHLPELGHDPEISEAKKPTCTESGLTEGMYCSRCGEILEPQKEISATGHHLIEDAAVPATFLEEGLTAGCHCSICNKVIMPQNVIPRLNATQEKRRRMAQLLDVSRSAWPLGRIVALGCTKKEYYILKEKCGEDTVLSLQKMRFLQNTENSCAWLEKLDSQSWELALILCQKITEIEKNFSHARVIALKKALGANDEFLAKSFGVTVRDIRSVYSSYVNALTDFFRENTEAANFLYPHDTFDPEIAEIFFGKGMFAQIRYCCDMERIHAFRSQILSKPVGLRATLKEEASNKRTKVLDNWGHLKKYIEDQFDSQPLLGNIELDDQEYGMLLDYLKKQYLRASSLWGEDMGRDKAVCAALVQIAVRCPGTAYWPDVAEILGAVSHQSEMRRLLGNCFLDTMKFYHKATYTSSEFVASIKMHTFMNNAGIPRLFDFLYAYYELDLGRNMDYANVEELRDLIISGSFSRKQLILQQTIDALRLVPEVGLLRMKTYLDWVDNAFWNPQWTPDGSDRFVQGFRDWCSQHTDFNGKWSLNVGKGGRGKRMYSQPTIEMDLRTGKMKIVLPVEKLPFDCETRTEWIIDTGERRVIPCELTESITCCMTGERECPLPLERLLSEIRIEFLNGDTVLKNYTIKSDCVRMFGAQGSMISGKHIGVGTTYFFMRPDAQIETDHPGIEQQAGPWLMKRIELREGDTILFPDDTLAIVGSDTVEGLCGHLPCARVRMLDGEGNQYPVYAELPKVLLKITDEQYDKTRVQINDSYLRLSALPCKKITLNERTAESGFLVSLPISAQVIYRINVDVPGDSRIRRWQIFFLNGFEYEFKNDEQGLPYWNALRGSIVFPDTIRLNGKGMDKDPDHNEFGFEISPENSDLTFGLTGTEYSLKIAVPACFWKSEKTEWSGSPCGDIWYKELPDSIELRIPEDSVTFYADKDGMANGQNIVFDKRKDAETILCDFLPLKSWMTRDKLFHTVFMRIGSTSYEFASVYCRSYFVSGQLEADYEEGLLRGSFDIIGKNEYVVSILKDGDEILSQIPLINGEFKVQMKVESGEYTAIVYEAFEDEFGFETVYDEVGRQKSKLLNPTDLTGTGFRLRKVDTLCGQKRELIIQRSYFHVRVEARDENNPHLYIGVLSFGNLIEQNALHVQIGMPDRNEINHLTILFDDDGEYASFLYDTMTRRIVKEEAQMPYMDRYRRYVLLDPDDTFTVEFDSE